MKFFCNFFTIFLDATYKGKLFLVQSLLMASYDDDDHSPFLISALLPPNKRKTFANQQNAIADDELALWIFLFTNRHSALESIAFSPKSDGRFVQSHWRL
jgi:hypothetical protein